MEDVDAAVLLEHDGTRKAMCPENGSKAEGIILIHAVEVIQANLPLHLTSFPSSNCSEAWRDEQCSMTTVLHKKIVLLN